MTQSAEATTDLLRYPGNDEKLGSLLLLLLDGLHIVRLRKEWGDIKPNLFVNLLLGVRG